MQNALEMQFLQLFHVSSLFEYLCKKNSKTENSLCHEEMVSTDGYKGSLTAYTLLL